MNPISDRFRKMADLIDRNTVELKPMEGVAITDYMPANFGGAFVIIGPSGDAIERLILDDTKDSAQFWGNLEVKAKIMLAELSDKERNNQAFGRR